MSPSAPQLIPQELEAVYAISRALLSPVDIDTAMDEIAHLARSVLIFDNLVLYQPNQAGILDPSFARAIGRGRFREADLAWGEGTAQMAFESGQIVNRVEQITSDQADRINTRYLLGLPVRSVDHLLGALVFIRFGGPSFTAPQSQLAELISTDIAQLLERNSLTEKVAALEAGRRLDALQDDFIATITHELLTPLGFIKGYATTLLREDIDWDPNTRREFLTYIDDEADRLRELIDNMLDSSRLQTGTLPMNFQPIRLEVLLRDVSIRARLRSEKLQITLQINEPGLQVMADPVRLAQVFDNILNNAAKYAANSPVTISVDGQANWAKITIQDQGPGISPEHIDKVFKRFYRIPNPTTSTRGTGLGLYICRKIIQAHQGEITVESIVGQGTTFIILLPYD